MRLTEWNEVLKYAEELCKDFKYFLRPATYTMYDGRKGIYLNLYDNEGKIFKQFATGIWDTAEQYKNALRYQFSNAIAWI